MGSFDYVVWSAQQELLVLRRYRLPSSGLSPEAVRAVSGTDLLLRSPFRAITLGVATPAQAIVPARLFNKAHAPQYLSHTTALAEGIDVLDNRIDAFGAQLVYPLPSSLNVSLRKAFPGCRVFHLGSALIEGQRRMGYAAHQPALFGHLQGGYFCVTVIEGGSLQYFSINPVQHAKDITYFLMLAYEQCQLSPEKHGVYLSGALAEDSDAFRSIKRYVLHVQFLTPGAYFKLGQVQKELQLYQYFSLLSLSFV